MSELGEFAQASLSRLSQMVGRLEKRGWVHRHPDPTDGRYTLATLTEDGMKALEDLGRAGRVGHGFRSWVVAESCRTSSGL